ncbi:Fe-S cluster assembly sulfur transfer protein SufU [Lactiplantibacillus mudanjiangensis]|uniref:NifU-like protein [Lactobacillus parabuchneri] n=1 Tax=Lactiplantibacillus mudanjiangensis TaxID=1296538 RepID=A0A660DZ56_9LACO|nr:SUF system NifU family Fe-S cluster assembly protein [Lactiplantibacillus mudanjiangensis]VDG26257.1 NifU-like protein [Lactobacillus parabuchneri] [Lactiplantibacillus mudanjiangensis]VDG27418.1 NifU-like protein [Lactobacillus parabuchneri] [Lactiplantibacillus mudanjiangensis]
MSLLKLNELYKTVILDHAQHPHHHGQLAEVPGVTLNNPSCGDVIQVQIEVQHQQINRIAFSGTGCTISQASASVMTDVLSQQTVTQAQQLIHDFSQLIMGKSLTTAAKHQLGDAAVLGTVAEFPTRIRCAMLAWHAAEQCLAEIGGTDNGSKS